MLPASMSLRRPAEQKWWRTTKETVKTNAAILSKFYNFRLLGVPNNPCGIIGMLNVNEGAAHVDNRLKILQRLFCRFRTRG